MDAMTMLHELDGRAFTLEASCRPRHLFVLEGRAWITQRLPAPPWWASLASMSARQPVAPLPDWWLVAGARMALPAGSRWIVQAEGDLRLALREVAPCSPRPTAFSRLSCAWAGWMPAGLSTPASAGSHGLAPWR
jgi:hypothetical protein